MTPPRRARSCRSSATSRGCPAETTDHTGDGSIDLLVAEGRGLRPQNPNAEKILHVISGRSLEREIAPRLGNVVPGSGPLLGGNPVMLLGAGLDQDAVVRFGGRVADIDEVIGAGILVVRAPPGTVPGDVPVSVTTRLGTTSDCVIAYTYESLANGITVGDGRTRALTLKRIEADSHRLLGVTIGDFNGERTRCTC